MTFDDLKAVVYEYAGDTSRSIESDRVGDALNRSHRVLGLIAEKQDPTLFQVHRLLTIPSSTGSGVDPGTIVAVELELPADFRHVIAINAGNTGSPLGLVPEVSYRLEVIPVSHWVRYSSPLSDIGYSNNAGVAYIRHSKVGESVPTVVVRYPLVEEVGAAWSWRRVTETKQPAAVGFSGEVFQGTSFRYAIIYTRYVEDMAADDSQPELPLEYHELIAVGAAMRLAAINNDPSFVRLLSRYKEGVSVMKQGLRSRRGELVA